MQKYPHFFMLFFFTVILMLTPHASLAKTFTFANFNDSTVSADTLVTADTMSVDTLAAADTTSIFFQDLEHFVEVGFRIMISPILFDAHDWKRLGLAATGTGLIFLLDKNVKKWALRNQSKSNNFIFNLDHYYGDQYSLFVAWGVYGYGALTGKDQVRKIGRNATEAFIFSGAITGAIKMLVGRRRPYAGDDNLFFKPFHFNENDYQSLPSGHTTVSFAVSTVMAKSMDNMYWKIFWYGCAGLVGASRVYHNKHWFSDVFLGAVIGYSVGNFTINFDRSKDGRIFGLRFQPYYGLSSLGLRCYF